MVLFNEARSFLDRFAPVHPAQRTAVFATKKDVLRHGKMRIPLRPEGQVPSSQSLGLPGGSGDQRATVVISRYASAPQRTSFRRRAERRSRASALGFFSLGIASLTGGSRFWRVNTRARSSRSSSIRSRMVLKSSAARGRATVAPVLTIESA